MSVLTRLLESYEKNHQNPVNEVIHFCNSVDYVFHSGCDCCI